jgi:hypothetical protein
MSNLYEVLEICLQEIEQGADIDTVLFRYPEFAEELRPILEASEGARHMAVPAPSAEVVRRNRARVLQRAAQLRETAAKPRATPRRIWFTSLRRVAVTLIVIALLFVSGTSLVRAASTTLPGDQLYPVKRTWEDVLLLFTFNSQQRETLEIEHENERHHELRELFAEGRSEDVEFSGLVTSQSGTEWLVEGVQVVISPETQMRGQGIVVGSAVRVEGTTQGSMTVFAEEIQLLPPGSQLPDLEDEHEGEEDNHEGEERKQKEDASSGSGSEAEVPNVIATESPDGASGEDQVSDGEPEDHKSDSGEDDNKSTEDDDRQEGSDDSPEDHGDSSEDDD